MTKMSSLFFNRKIPFHAEPAHTTNVPFLKGFTQNSLELKWVKILRSPSHHLSVTDFAQLVTIFYTDETNLRANRPSFHRSAASL